MILVLLDNIKGIPCESAKKEGFFALKDPPDLLLLIQPSISER